MPTIGLYQFDEEVGCGAIGRVYKGRHMRTNKNVAGKKITVEKEFYEEKYEKEARLVKDLPSHDNVVKVFGTEKREYKEGGVDYVELWIISELIPYSLKGFASTYDLSVDHKLDLMVQCCRGLLHLHQHDLVHRDVKPENIMVDVNKGGKPVIKIIDFGEARIVDEVEGRTALMKSFVGTLEYMAPELLQRQGSLLTPNYRTSVDVFALGITFLSLIESKKGQLMTVIKGMCFFSLLTN